MTKMFLEVTKVSGLSDTWSAIRQTTYSILLTLWHCSCLLSCLLVPWGSLPVVTWAGRSCQSTREYAGGARRNLAFCTLLSTSSSSNWLPASDFLILALTEFLSSQRWCWRRSWWCCWWFGGFFSMGFLMWLSCSRAVLMLLWRALLSSAAGAKDEDDSCVLTPVWVLCFLRLLTHHSNMETTANTQTTITTETSRGMRRSAGQKEQRTVSNWSNLIQNGVMLWTQAPNEQSSLKSFI